jgi:hypothetical protein
MTAPLTRVSVAPKALVAALLAALALGGCGNVRESLGLVRSSPDEFTVVAKAPLVLPPDFSLRPPIPGAPPIAQAADPQAQAFAALTNAGRGPAAAAAPARPGLTAGENALLGAAGAGMADPGIRARVDLETRQIAERQRTAIEALLFWQNRPEKQALDPAAEAARLRAQGQPTTGGQLPTARRVGTGLFN